MPYGPTAKSSHLPFYLLPYWIASSLYIQLNAGIAKYQIQHSRFCDAPKHKFEERIGSSMNRSTLVLLSSMLILTIALIFPQNSAYARSDDWCIGDPTILIDGRYVLHTTVAIPQSQLVNVILHGPVTLTVAVPKGVQAYVIERISPFPIVVNIVQQDRRGADMPVQIQTFVPNGKARDTFAIRMNYLNVNGISLGSAPGTSGTVFNTSIDLSQNTSSLSGIPLPDLLGGLR